MTENELKEATEKIVAEYEQKRARLLSCMIPERLLKLLLLSLEGHAARAIAKLHGISED